MLSLSEYVRTVLREKNLTLADVHLRSRGRISGGYVNDILNEKTVNPSVQKLQALALGLGVSEDDLFKVSRGLPLEESDGPASSPDESMEEALSRAHFFHAKGLSDAEILIVRPILEALDKQIEALTKE